MLRTPERLQEEFGIEAEAGRERALARVWLGWKGPDAPSSVDDDDDDEDFDGEAAAVPANSRKYDLVTLIYTMVISRALPQENDPISAVCDVRQIDLAAMRGVRRETITRQMSRYTPLIESLCRKHDPRVVQILTRKRRFALANEYSWGDDQPMRIFEWDAVREFTRRTITSDGEEVVEVYEDVERGGFRSKETCRAYCEEHNANAQPGRARLVVRKRVLPNDQKYKAATLEQYCADPEMGHMWDATLLGPKRAYGVGGFKKCPVYQWDGRICVRDWIVKDDLGNVLGRWPLFRSAQAFVDELKKDQADETKRKWAKNRCEEDPGIAARLTVTEAPDDWVVEELNAKGHVHGRWPKDEFEQAKAYVDELKKDASDPTKKEWAREECAKDPTIAARLTIEEQRDGWWVVQELISKGVELGRWQNEADAQAFVLRTRRRDPKYAAKLVVCRRARRLSDVARMVMTYYFMCGIMDIDPKTGRPKGILDSKDANGVQHGGPKQSTIARALGISKRAVYDANCELEAIGLIRVAHPEPQIVMKDGQKKYKRGSCIIIYLPIRQLTREEAQAERQRLNAELRRFPLAMGAEIAGIHEDLLRAWQGEEHGIKALWSEFVRRMIAKGISRRVASSLVPSLIAPP